MTGQGYNALANIILGAWAAVIGSVVALVLCLIYAPWLLLIALTILVPYVLIERHKNMTLKKQHEPKKGPKG